MANEYYSIKLPEYKKATVEIWKFLTPNELDTLLGCFDIDDTSEYLKRLENYNIKINRLDLTKKLNQYDLFSRLFSHLFKLNLSNKKDLIQIDTYFYLIKYSLENKFKKEQISALISVLKRTHDLAMSTSFGNLDETFDYFKNLILCYTVHRPPFSVYLFSTRQVESIINYFLNAYFKQFKFYKYVYSSAILLNFDFKYTNLEQEEEKNVNVNEFEKLDDYNDIDVSVVDQNDDIQRSESRLTPNQLRQDTTNELKDFIKSYLNQHLDKMKNDLLKDDLFQTKSRSMSSNGNKTPNKKKH